MDGSWLVLALFGLTLFSLLLTGWQWLEGRLFPLHRRSRPTQSPPGVTLLKPLNGCDEATEACLRSWLTQNYAGPVQVLFAVTSEHDSVYPVVRRLLAEHPELDAECVVCPELQGTNVKVAKLVHLEPRVRHEVLVISDADVKAPPDFLTNLVAPFDDAQVGLVNCFYRFGEPVTMAMQCEAVAINADFWTSVLQALRLAPMRFALGAVMAVRRSAVQAIGGLGLLRDFLADDYELGRRVSRAGSRVVLCPVVVDCYSPPQGWRAVWRHQLRWARTIRVCQPLAYGASIVSNATLWPLLLWLAAPGPTSVLMLTVCLLVRLLTALDNQRRLCQSLAHLPWWWLPPLKDLLQVVWWAMAFLGNRIEWQGRQLRVTRAGRVEVPGALPKAVPGLAAAKTTTSS
jgi:ceramide glucosyltransferase